MKICGKCARRCNQAKDWLVAFPMWPPRNIAPKSASETSNLQKSALDVDSLGALIANAASGSEPQPKLGMAKP